MRYRVIVNPAAGRGRCLKIWQGLEPLARKLGLDFDAYLTTGPGDATAQAKAALNLGLRRLVAVGGDGTIAEVVNATCGTQTALGVIPAGTGNDFARSAGLPRVPEVALRALSEARVRRLDVGRVNGRFFVNVGGAGFDAEVARLSNTRARFLSGTPAYVFSVLWTLASYRPTRLIMTLDGVAREAPATMIAVANGSYYGGGMWITPEAKMDDGLLDVCVIGPMGRVELLAAFPRVFKGTHVTHPRISFYRARSVRLEVAEPGRTVYAHADGEHLGALPLEFSVSAGAQSVLYPDGNIVEVDGSWANQ